MLTDKQIKLNSFCHKTKILNPSKDIEYCNPNEMYVNYNEHLRKCEEIEKKVNKQYYFDKDNKAHILKDFPENTKILANAKISIEECEEFLTNAACIFNTKYSIAKITLEELVCLMKK